MTGHSGPQGSLGTTLLRSLKAFARLSDASRLSIWLQTGGRLVRVENLGVERELIRAVPILPIGQGAAGLAAAESRTVVLSDCFRSPHLAPYWDVLRRFGVSALWSVPLQAERLSIGAVVFYYPTPFVPSDSIIREGEQLADIVSEALERRLTDRRIWTGTIESHDAHRRRMRRAAAVLHNEVIRDLLGVELMLDMTIPGHQQAARAELRSLVERLREVVRELMPDDAEGAGKSSPQQRGRRERGTDLTYRELTVLSLLARGRTNKEIAHELHVTEDTAKYHVRELFRRLDASTRTEVVWAARQQGYIQ
jgi:DNA-binding CsgD family transcriptional regulator